MNRGVQFDHFYWRMTFDVWVARRQFIGAPAVLANQFGNGCETQGCGHVEGGMAPGSIADRDIGSRVREEEAHYLDVTGRGRVEERGLSILIHEVDLQLGTGEETPHHFEMAGEGRLAERRPSHVILEIDLNFGTLQQEFDHSRVSALGGDV